ncbi:MAG: Gfo/Idh/MocA family oxidoreductase [Spirochaetaceae bacterium]
MEKIKICLVGLGFGQHIAEEHLLSGPGSPYFKLVAVCDMDRQRVDDFAQKYGLKAYYSLEDALQAADIKVIGLFTGPVGRAKQIDKIIEAGKDVMTTKPFEMNSQEALRVLKKAERLGRMVHLNSPNIAPSLDIQIIHDFIKKYNLGKLCAGRWEGWYKKIEKADGSWYDDPALCPAPPILRLGIYGLNDLVPLFGNPVKVDVMQSRMLTARPTADLAQMMVKFDSGAMFTMLGGWCMQPYRGGNMIQLHFEHGTIVREPKWRAGKDFTTHSDLSDGLNIRVYTAAKGFSEPVEERHIQDSESSASYQWDKFYEAVKERKNFVNGTKPEDIANVIKVVELMAEASLNNPV